MEFLGLANLPFHTNLAKTLLKSISNKRLHHAYLFYGEQGAAQLKLALEFTRHLMCPVSMVNPCGTCPTCFKLKKLQHPDLLFYFPVNRKNDEADPKSIEEGVRQYAENPYKEYIAGNARAYYVETMRHIKDEASSSSFESPHRVILLDQIEFMNDASANAFLKLLEEPPKNTFIIMTSSAIEQILPTIKSRCQKFHLNHLPESQVFQIAKTYYPNLNKSDLSLKLAAGNLSKVFDYQEMDFTALRNTAINFLRFAIVHKPIGIVENINLVLASKEKQDVEAFLNFLLFWFRDASFLLASGDEAHLIDADLVKELRKFIERFGQADFVNMSLFLEEALFLIKRNVHQGMVLSQLAVKLNKEFSKK
jgi:DNA polymerase-3 subunit delta'